MCVNGDKSLERLKWLGAQAGGQRDSSVIQKHEMGLQQQRGLDFS